MRKCFRIGASPATSSASKKDRHCEEADRRSCETEASFATGQGGTTVACEEAQLSETSPELLAEQVGKQLAYFYDPKGKPDPFQPLFATEAQRMAPDKKKGKKKKRLPLTPLQRISLSQLKLVGIILSPTGNKALVEEPSGKGYIISKGTYVGTNFGRVKKVLNDRVIVEEEVEDFSGKMKPQRRELRLQKRPGHV